MDSMDKINTPWVDPDHPNFPENHPGLADTEYMRRRLMFFYMARDHRLRNLPTPQFTYTETEQQLWNQVFTRLTELHEESACTIYKKGKQILGLSGNRPPHLNDLQNTLQPITGVKITPAEGLLHGKTYFDMWADKVMPCTQFLRHPRQPNYTPEPDIIHDVIGHVPPLADADYTAIIQRIGQIARAANPDQLDQLVRFYWFTIEFGLLEENSRTTILGAGILSSIEEFEHSMSGQAEIRPFDLEVVMNTPFDTTHLQSTIFIAPSVASIQSAADELANRWNITS
jgi:phenylalanine-4-hydroxylase